MSIERGQVQNLASELWRLVRTRDYQGFVEGINYYQKMREIDANLQTPEARKKIEEMVQNLQNTVTQG